MKRKRVTLFLKTERERKMADLFNRQAKIYAEAQPSYPLDLFQFIASETPEHELAWDVGTGNGQAAVSGIFLPWTELPNFEDFWILSIHGEANVSADLVRQSIASGDLVDSQHVNLLCCWNLVFLPMISAFQLDGIYKNVVGMTQVLNSNPLERSFPTFVTNRAPAMTVDELKANVASHQSVDLVTVAQAFHWFDRCTFYQQVRCLLKRANGVLAIWSYTLPRVNESIDDVLERVYSESDPFWGSPHKMVDDEYRSFEFPFEPVEGTEHTAV